MSRTLTGKPLSAARPAPLICALAVCLLAVGAADAGVTGATFRVILDASVTDPTGVQPPTREGHNAAGVLFDGVAELLPADAIPTPAPPFLPPNDLVINEFSTANADGTESLFFLIDGLVAGQPLFTTGASLITNPITPGAFDPAFGDVVFVVADFVLPATNPGSLSVLDVTAQLTFPGVALPTPTTVLPFGGNPASLVAGDGTSASPLSVGFSLPPGDLVQPLGTGGAPSLADGLIVEVVVRNVPEPHALAIAGTLLGLLATRRPSTARVRTSSGTRSGRRRCRRSFR